MIRMQLGYLNIARGILYGSGMLLALYILFDIKVTKRSILDGLICIGWYYLVNTHDSWLLWKEVLTILVGVGLLVLNNRKQIFSASLFAFVLYLMLVLSYPMIMIIFVNVPGIIDSVENQTSNFYSNLSVFIGGSIVLINYVLASYILRKMIDINWIRLKRVYQLFALINIVLVFMLSMFLHYIVNDFAVGFSVIDRYNVMIYSFISMLFFPFIELILLKNLYQYDVEIEKLENQLDQIDDSRMIAYRYSHNLNSIMVTVNLLAKKGNMDEIEKYLHELESR